MCNYNDVMNWFILIEIVINRNCCWPFFIFIKLFRFTFADNMGSIPSQFQIRLLSDKRCFWSFVREWWEKMLSNLFLGPMQTVRRKDSDTTDDKSGPFVPFPVLRPPKGFLIHASSIKCWSLADLIQSSWGCVYSFTHLETLRFI